MDSETNGTTIPKEETPMGVEPAVEGKGKGKAPIEQIIDAAMEDDEEDEEEEDEEEPSGMLEEDEEEDDMQEIEEDNIVGSRTRGKTIDYAKAAENMDEEEYDEDDDEDFEDEDNDESMT